MVAVSMVLCVSQAARAQGFISPFLGYNFGGDSGCPEISNCKDKHANYGVSFGTAGLIGFEEEFAYAKNFFGEQPGVSSSVMTLMSNLMIAPGIPIVRPYAVIGLGLIKSHADFSTQGLLDTTNNDFGWDIGGGLMLMFGHFGLRGDIRYFHAFSSLDFAGLTISDLKLDYGRAAGGVVLSF
jgi:hypothetical protein